MLDTVERVAVLQLCDALEMRLYKKGATIQFENQVPSQVFFIKKGHVKIGSSVNGRFNLEFILGKANLFGDAKITMGEEGKGYKAIAMSNCTLCIIDAMHREDLMHRYPKLHSFILKTLGLRYHKIERRLHDILYKDAATRIGDFIYDFVLENGHRSQNSIYAQNIFSHKDIARLTSTSRQTVNNVISKLRKSVGLAYDRKEIRINMDLWS